MKVAAAIAEILEREGVDVLVAYPVNPVIEAAAAADIRTVIVRQERTGLHMADAYARLHSGKRVGAFAMQHGPGAENAFGGVAQAYSESAPVLVVPAGYARRSMHVEPNYSSFLNLQHVTKLSDVLLSGAHTQEVFRRAFSALRTGRPRPVSVEVPVDVFGEEVPDDFDYTPTRHVRSAPDPADVATVAGMIAGAERPVLYVGQGVHYAAAWAEVRELAESWSIPVCTSLEGKSAFPEDHPLYLGCGGRSMPRAVRTFLDESDLVVGLGVSFARTAFGVRMPAGVPLVQNTVDPADLNRELPVAAALVGDAQLALQGLLAELKGRPRSPATERRAEGVAAQIAAVNGPWLEEWQPRLSSGAVPIDPYRVIGELGRNLDPREVIITHDAGSPRDQITPFWVSTEPLSYLGWGKTTQLGYGLGLAMGAKLARPDKTCVNVWGDAAIGFTGMDFETAVRERLPILSILLNNFSMAIELPIMQQAQAKYGSCDISGNYAEFARALGGYGERVTEPSEVGAAIRRGIERTRQGSPALLEFITAKDHTYSVF
ncbi:MAG: thiamine pyrophosphate-requiring protein [Acidimicrobiia bacterium]|nr:thiamine pyrophosphate-requiring protein [Acidimicrobiia bacterium]